MILYLKACICAFKSYHIFNTFSSRLLCIHTFSFKIFVIFYLLGAKGGTAVQATNLNAPRCPHTPFLHLACVLFSVGFIICLEVRFGMKRERQWRSTRLCATTAITDRCICCTTSLTVNFKVLSWRGQSVNAFPCVSCFLIYLQYEMKNRSNQ